MPPRLFIGSSSSSESLTIANAVQQNLQHFAHCEVWTQSIFRLGETTIDSLLNAVTTHDFGVFVLAPEDIATIRDSKFAVARDNVLFESALFMGRYARDRAFLVKPMGATDFHIPSDLLGLTMAEYDSAHCRKNAVASLGPASTRIRDAITGNASFNRRLTITPTAVSAEGATFPLKLWLRIRNATNDDAVVRSHYFLCNNALHPHPGATAIGHPTDRRYEIRFPSYANPGGPSAFDYLLRHGETVNAWFPIAATQNEEDVRNAIVRRQCGELNITCIWLGAPPMSSDITECL